MIVKSELKNLGLDFTSVELGEVEMNGKVSNDQLDQLNSSLKMAGLELLTDTKKILVDKIVINIIDLIHYRDEQIKINLSDYLSEKLRHNYTYLSNIFSEINGITIEQYYLNTKIEKVKELLVYDELSLTEIAWKLHYSSVSHLSGQFKKMTGLTPSAYKSLKVKGRSFIGNL